MKQCELHVRHPWSHSQISAHAAPLDIKFPGDDCPVVWGKCNHPFHLPCINKWLTSQGAEQAQCPLCRLVGRTRSAYRVERKALALGGAGNGCSRRRRAHRQPWEFT